MTGFETTAALAILLVRPGMLVLATPYFGAAFAPAPVRVGATVMLALVLAPVVTVPAGLPAVGLTAVVAREVAIGLALAFAIRVLVAGAEFAGHFAGYQLGLSLGALIDPQTGVRNNVLALLYANVVIVICFVTNAHHSLLRALVDSYRALPIGFGGLSPDLAGAVAGLIGLVFVLGVRVAAPVVIVMLLAEIVLGLLGRIAPALNVMIAGAPIRLVAGLLVVAATMAFLPGVVSAYAESAFRLAAELAAGFR